MLENTTVGLVQSAISRSTYIRGAGLTFCLIRHCVLHTLRQEVSATPKLEHPPGAGVRAIQAEENPPGAPRGGSLRELGTSKDAVPRKAGAGLPSAGMTVGGGA